MSITGNALIPLPIHDAPRDHTMLRLLVDYSGDTGHHSLEDVAETAWTIGFNGFDDTGIDEWQFVAWSWEQDVFFDARAPTHGRVIGWAHLTLNDGVVDDIDAELAIPSIDEYVEGYQCENDEGTIVPTPLDRFLIADALHGYMAEVDTARAKQDVVNPSVLKLSFDAGWRMARQIGRLFQGQVRHLKRGHVYDVLGDAEIQISIDDGTGINARLITEGEKIRVYRHPETAKLWARFPDEFTPDRFEELELTPPTDPFGLTPEQLSGKGWMVVGVDNHNRESVADFTVCRDVRSREIAEGIAMHLNADAGASSGTWYRAVPHDYKPCKGMWDLT